MNAIGKTAQSCLIDIPKHFPQTTIDEHIIMPNHVHVIIIIGDGSEYNEGTIYRAPTKAEGFAAPKSGTLSRIICVYKAAVTREINKRDAGNTIRIWQRNYYEHIIRNEKELFKIRNYIRNNPQALLMKGQKET